MFLVLESHSSDTSNANAVALGRVDLREKLINLIQQLTGTIEPVVCRGIR